MGQTAIVIGATGLVGSEIFKQALDDPRFDLVKTFSRGRTALSHAKHAEFIVDFGTIEKWKHDLTGDVLFSALGTTRSQAGSIAAQRKIDYNYQLEVAKAAHENGVKNYVLISSGMASSSSSNPYLRMKGELERDALALGFESTTILRPGPLTGHRKHPRMSEKILTTVLGILPMIGPLKSFRPVHGKHVAHVGIESVFRKDPKHSILEPNEILEFPA